MQLSMLLDIFIITKNLGTSYKPFNGSKEVFYAIHGCLIMLTHNHDRGLNDNDKY